MTKTSDRLQDGRRNPTPIREVWVKRGKKALAATLAYSALTLIAWFLDLGGLGSLVGVGYFLLMCAAAVVTVALSIAFIITPFVLWSLLLPPRRPNPERK